MNAVLLLATLLTTYSVVDGKQSSSVFLLAKWRPILYIFEVSVGVANYMSVVTKITHPFLVGYFLNLVPNADRARDYLVSHAFMAAISNWYLIFMELLIPYRNKVCAILF